MVGDGWWVMGGGVLNADGRRVCQNLSPITHHLSYSERRKFRVGGRQAEGWWVMAYSMQTGEEFARTYHPSPNTFFYSERRKFSRSCFCDVLRALKLLTTASASEPQNWRKVTGKNARLSAVNI